MYIAANDVRLWFDVDGPALVPDASAMRPRHTVVLVHGGPGSFDHSYFKPDFGRLASVAQVVYLDLRGHGRSTWGDPTSWSIEACADDLRAFCDALGIVRPIIFGHSLGAFIAAMYATRHPDHPTALVLQSGTGRFDVNRVAEGFRKAGGDRAGAAAARFYGGDMSAVDEFRALCRPLFGRWVPGDAERARIIANPALGEPGLARMREFDILADLRRVTCPTLVCAGELDPITQVADARELAAAIPTAQLRVLADVGHFPWKDDLTGYWPPILDFIAKV